MAEDKKNVAPAKVEHTAVKKVDSNEKLTLAPAARNGCGDAL
jgi:hypothetical protein